MVPVDPSRPLSIARRVAMLSAVVLLMAFARPRPLDLLVGIPLVAAGEALRLWAAGYLDKNVRLVTAGPYRFLRNPLYLGRLLIFTGLCLVARLPRAANAWLVLPAGWAIFFLYYLPRKEHVEPARLLALHGQRFEAYRRDVPALLPRLRPWPGGSVERWSPKRAFSNREHWMVLGLLGALLYGWLRSGSG